MHKQWASMWQLQYLHGLKLFNMHVWQKTFCLVLLLLPLILRRHIYIIRSRYRCQLMNIGDRLRMFPTKLTWLWWFSHDLKDFFLLKPHVEKFEFFRNHNQVSKSYRLHYFLEFSRFFSMLASIFRVHFSKSSIGQNRLVNINSLGPK